MLMLKHVSGLADVGIYSVATTLGIIFHFVPSAISSLLMPQTSGLSFDESRQLLKKMLLLCFIITCGLMIFFVLCVNWFVGAAFGPAYLAGVSVYMVQAVASAASGIHSVITATVVGSGRPAFETISRIITLAAIAITAWFFIPAYGPLGAATAACAGSLAGLLVYGLCFNSIPRTAGRQT
jgi:O-antigen/teichoic acid export membrane protein